MLKYCYQLLKENNDYEKMDDSCTHACSCI